MRHAPRHLRHESGVVKSDWWIALARGTDTITELPFPIPSSFASEASASIARAMAISSNSWARVAESLSPLPTTHVRCV